MAANLKTAKWKPLEIRLADWMKARAEDKLTFCNGFTAIPGFKSNGFRADGILTDGESLLALEVECKQSHPDTNVGKFWLLQNTNPYKRMTLVHVFTPAYNSYQSRHGLCQFYADKMKSEFDFEYIPLDRRTADDSEFDAVFTEVSTLLSKRFKAFFR